MDLCRFKFGAEVFSTSLTPRLAGAPGRRRSFRPQAESYLLGPMAGEARSYRPEGVITPCSDFANSLRQTAEIEEQLLEGSVVAEVDGVRVSAREDDRSRNSEATNPLDDGGQEATHQTRQPSCRARFKIARDIDMILGDSFGKTSDSDRLDRLMISDRARSMLVGTSLMKEPADNRLAGDVHQPLEGGSERLELVVALELPTIPQTQGLCPVFPVDLPRSLVLLN
nr:hypothetical protein Iba_chr01dCG4670 [Ipomoea batatas]